MYPALVVADELRRQVSERANRPPAGRKHRDNITGSADSESNILYLGRAGAIEERLALRNNIPFQSVDVGGVRGLAPWTAVGNLAKLFGSIRSVRRTIRTFKPNVTLATGGYVSAPTVWASAAEHVPSVIYLPDLEPGWAVRATAPLATRVAVSFPEVTSRVPRGKGTVTGYPVRREFFQVRRERARRAFDLNPLDKTVTIFGGSRGAHHINVAAIQNLVELSHLAQIVLVTGTDDEAWAKEQAGTLAASLSSCVRVYGYLEEQLPEALAAADIVVARAGAATLGEFPALGMPAILVPYPYAGRHQERNADFLIKRGAAVKISDADLAKALVPTLKSLLDAPEQLARMAAASQALAQPSAAANLVALLNTLAGEGA